MSGLASLGGLFTGGARRAGGPSALANLLPDTTGQAPRSSPQGVNNQLDDLFGGQQGGLGSALGSLFGVQGAGGVGGGFLKLLDNLNFAVAGDNFALTAGGQQNQQDDQERFIRQLEQMFNSMNDGSGGASAPKSPGFTISPGKNPVTPQSPRRVVGPQFGGQFGGPQFGGGVF